MSNLHVSRLARGGVCFALQYWRVAICGSAQAGHLEGGMERLRLDLRIRTLEDWGWMVFV